MKQEKKTYYEVVIGIIFCAVLFAIPGIFWTGRRSSYFFGLLLGILIAILMTKNLYHTINKALDMEQKSASGYTRRTALFRSLLMIIALALSIIFPKVFHILGVILGILCLKFSAYLQPLTHKYLFQKILDKGR